MEQKAIKDFIEAITPGNWIVLTEHQTLAKRFKNGFQKLDTDSPCRLYISLFVENQKHDEDEFRTGEIHGHINEYSGFSVCELFVYPHSVEGFSWQGTVIHELAHVAVDRWVRFKMRGERPFSFIEAQHGPVFEKAKLRILERARVVLGERFNEVEDEVTEEFFFE